MKKKLWRLILCDLALPVALVLVYLLLDLLFPADPEFFYSITENVINAMVPVLLAVGFSAAVFHLLQNEPRWLLTMLLNAVAITAIYSGATWILMFDTNWFSLGLGFDFFYYFIIIGLSAVAMTFLFIRPRNKAKERAEHSGPELSE